jgi:hypothetical protein
VPVETFGYPDSLNASYPPTSDGLVGGDDHIRGIKATIKNTFPGIAAAASRAISASFGWLVGDGAAATPSYSFVSEPTLGFYRISTGLMGVAGGKLKGALPVGGLHMFLVEPAGLGKGAVGTGHDYLELDGSTWPNSAFPDLAAHLNQGGTSFTLPDAKSTGRFPRSRTATVAAGTAQANTVGPHTHPDVTKTTGTESADHTHPFSGTTGSMNQNASHSHGYVGPAQGVGTGTSPNYFSSSTSNQTTAAANTDHQHAFSGTTSGKSTTHTHQVTVDTPANTGTTETRPEALSAVFCIKT